MILLGLALALSACAGQMPEQAAAHSPNDTMPDAGVWPENTYTEGLPVPPGSVSWAVLDTAEGYCGIFLTDLTQGQYRTYMERLREDGFSILEEISEEVGGQDYVSIGTVLSNQEKSLSISYTPDNLGIYISLTAEP